MTSQVRTVLWAVFGMIVLCSILAGTIGSVLAQSNFSQPIPVQPAAAGGNPCRNPTATLLAVAGSTSGTAATQIIAASGSTKIFVCSLTITGVSGTTPTFSLEYGTGTNCATSPVVFIGAWTTAASTVYPFAYPVFVTPASQAICYLDTGTTPVQRYVITYVQQ